MQIRFWGAAQEVTGSMHEVQVGGARILLDCGLLQGKRQLTYERNSRFPFSADDIDAVILSHAHLDHSGNLPTLCRQGFQGSIHSSTATMDLCRYMLADSAHLQEHDAQYIEQRRERWKQIQMDGKHAAIPALYNMEDVYQALNQFVPMKCNVDREIAQGVTVQLKNAGHLLGSAFVLLRLSEGGPEIRLLFSGDLGRPGLPIVRDPEPAMEADYLLLESTYGDRLHNSISTAKEMLKEYIGRTIARGGRVIVPSFAVGRTQQIVLLLHELMLESQLPDIPIFVDSPLALNVTDIYRSHPEEFDAETMKFSSAGVDPFGFQRLRYLHTPAESKALNDLRRPFIVISSAGMCEGGRILHHLKNGVEDSRNLILLAGYQAAHTLGRRIAERQKEIPILGEQYLLRAEVAVLDELSGHADQKDLINWVRPIARSLKKIFLVHGEAEAQATLAGILEREFSVPVEIPAHGTTHSLA